MKKKEEELNEQKNDGIVVGMIGYPNVGKSSIINVLWGSKKVGVGATPGKTKHFQTLILSDEITLCDCPGLVFPTLMSSKADLVLNGVLGIDTLTDFLSPSRLMFHRLGPQKMIDYYNLNGNITTKNVLLNPKSSKKTLTVFDILDSFCHQRSLFGHSHVPLRNDAARILLKDYVNGKLVYVHPPPYLSQHHRYLFQKGEIIRPSIETVSIEDSSMKNKINGQKKEKEENEEEEGEFQEEEEDEDENNSGDNVAEHMGSISENNKEKKSKSNDITDEEFLELWKHPLDNYSEGRFGTSKTKHERKARVLRRIEKKQSKNSRLFRKDADNFKFGSNLISTSSVPFVSTVYGQARI